MAKKPRIYGTFGPFVFAYPHLTSPDSEGQYADNKYKVDGVGDPKAKPMVDAQAAVADALKQFGLKAKGTNIPIKKETSKGEDGKKSDTGKFVFRTKSQYAPAIADASGNPIPDKALKKLKIGAGSEGLLQGYFSPYETTEKVRNADGELETVTVTGVSFTLTGVQLIKLVKGAGAASFAAYQGGGFTYEGGDDESSDGDEGGLDIGSDDDDGADGDEGGLDI